MELSVNRMIGEPIYYVLYYGSRNWIHLCGISILLFFFCCFKQSFYVIWAIAFLLHISCLKFHISMQYLQMTLSMLCHLSLFPWMEPTVGQSLRRCLTYSGHFTMKAHTMLHSSNHQTKLITFVALPDRLAWT